MSWAIMFTVMVIGYGALALTVMLYNRRTYTITRVVGDDHSVKFTVNRRERGEDTIIAYASTTERAEEAIKQDVAWQKERRRAKRTVIGRYNSKGKKVAW